MGPAFSWTTYRWGVDAVTLESNSLHISIQPYSSPSTESSRLFKKTKTTVIKKWTHTDFFFKCIHIKIFIQNHMHRCNYEQHLVVKGNSNVHRFIESLRLQKIFIIIKSNHLTSITTLFTIKPVFTYHFHVFSMLPEMVSSLFFKGSLFQCFGTLSFYFFFLPNI